MFDFIFSGFAIFFCIVICFFICIIYGFVVWRMFEKRNSVLFLLRIYAVKVEVAMKSQLSLFIPLITFCLMAFLFSNRNQTEPLYEAAFLLSCATIPLIVVSYSLMKVKILKVFVKHPVSRLVWVIVGIVGLWLAHATSAEVLNSAYNVDASNMPIALAAGTFFKAIGFLSIPVLLFSLFIEIVVICISFRMKFKRFSIRNVIRILSPYCIFTLVCISAQGMSSLGLGKKSNYLLVSIAYDLDFTKNHYCADVRKNEKVLIISSKPDRGIAFSGFNNFKKPFRLLTDKDIEKHSPKQGRLVQCL